MPQRLNLILLIAIASSSAIAADEKPAPETGKYIVVKTLPVGGEGRWDFITVDPASKLLYVGRSTYTQVIDSQTGKVIAEIKDTPGVHGVALAPDADRGFISNGRSNSVTLFDLKTNKTLGTIKTGQNPDAIIYDPATKTICAFNGRSNDVTVIESDAQPDSKPWATVALGGKPESAVSDAQGHVYVNLEDKSEIAVIDTKEGTVTAHWKIEGGEEPSGLAIDTANHRLFAGCGGNQVMAVLDTQSGKTLATLPIGKGVDACAFDEGTKEAFASCGDGTMTVIKETSPSKFEVTQTVPTRRGARTVAVDPATHALYLPTAEFKPMPTTTQGRQRPEPKPDSFMIVVVGRQ